MAASWSSRAAAAARDDRGCDPGGLGECEAGGGGAVGEDEGDLGGKLGIGGGARECGHVAAAAADEDCGPLPHPGQPGGGAIVTEAGPAPGPEPATTRPMRKTRSPA